MVKKIFYKVRGFTPLELLIVVSISAVVAGLFIFTANAPQPMASVPPISVNVEQLQVTVSQQDVNINVEQPQVFALGAATARRGNIAHAHPSPHSDHVVDLGGDACEVIPTGDYSQDAYHVQYAVDESG